MIKSQDDLNPCNDGKRSSDVVLSAVDKCERLQKQLDIAVKCLKNYKSGTTDKWFAEVALEQIEGLNEISKQK